MTRLSLYAASLVAATLSYGIASAGEIFTTDGVAIHGYDPVAYFTDHSPVKGSKNFTATFEGATFYFASAAHRDEFKADPAHYAPAYGGFCAFGTAQGHKAPTEPQAFTIANGKLYLNYNDDVMKTWRQDIPGYIQKANDNWGDVRQQATQ